MFAPLDQHRSQNHANGPPFTLPWIANVSNNQNFKLNLPSTPVNEARCALLAQHIFSFPRSYLILNIFFVSFLLNGSCSAGVGKEHSTGLFYQSGRQGQLGRVPLVSPGRKIGLSGLVCKARTECEEPPPVGLVRRRSVSLVKFSFFLLATNNTMNADL